MILGPKGQDVAAPKSIFLPPRRAARAQLVRDTAWPIRRLPGTHTKKQKTVGPRLTVTSRYCGLYGRRISRPPGPGGDHIHPVSARGRPVTSKKRAKGASIVWRLCVPRRLWPGCSISKLQLRLATIGH